MKSNFTYYTFLAESLNYLPHELNELRLNSLEMEMDFIMKNESPTWKTYIYLCRTLLIISKEHT